MRLLKTIFLPGTFFILTTFLIGGCTTIVTTTPPRTALEQLLLSTATDRALRAADLSAFSNRTVYLDTSYFDSYDSKYVIGTIRDALSRAGARLEASPASSDIIVEARSGALSIDGSDTLFGIPNMGLPIPLAGALQIPEVAFYKSDKQHSTAKFALLAFARESGQHIYSSGSLDGKSFHKRFKILFITWIHTDVPEKQKTAQKTEQCETWFPQYDLMNLPATKSPVLKPAPIITSPSPSKNTNAPAM